MDSIEHELEWTEERLERFWSYWGDRVHTYFAESFGPQIIDRTAGGVALGALCVDYGCGSGGLTAALLNQGFKVWAVDYARKSVEAVARRFADEKDFLGAFTVADLRQMDFQKADLVYSVETIEHVLGEQLGDYFANIRYLLKSDGKVIFSTPNNEDIEAAKVFCPESGAVFHPMQHIRSFDESAIEALIEAHGLTPEHTFITDFGISLTTTPKRWLADKGKRFLSMGMPPPHLVCIASASGSV